MKNQSEDTPCVSGEIFYNLRNNVLHPGTFNIDKKHDIQNFELLVQNPNAMLISSTWYIVHHCKDGKIVHSNRYLCINVVILILNLCKAVKDYYEKHKENLLLWMKKLLQWIS